MFGSMTVEEWQAWIQDVRIYWKISIIAVAVLTYLALPRIQAFFDKRGRHD